MLCREVALRTRMNEFVTPLRCFLTPQEPPLLARVVIGQRADFM